jgi:hypothetical protein
MSHLDGHLNRKQDSLEWAIEDNDPLAFRMITRMPGFDPEQPVGLVRIPPLDRALMRGRLAMARELLCRFPHLAGIAPDQKHEPFEKKRQKGRSPVDSLLAWAPTGSEDTRAQLQLAKGLIAMPAFFVSTSTLLRLASRPDAHVWFEQLLPVLIRHQALSADEVSDLYVTGTAQGHPALVEWLDRFGPPWQGTPVETRIRKMVNGEAAGGLPILHPETRQWWQTRLDALDLDAGLPGVDDSGSPARSLRL